MIFVDTHVVIWLYQKERGKFSDKAAKLIEANDLLISPIVRLELQFLFEIDRIADRPGVILDYLRGKIGLRVDPVELEDLGTLAEALTWTRDPFDRLIAAHAALRSLPLLTKDSHLLKNAPMAVWN